MSLTKALDMYALNFFCLYKWAAESAGSPAETFLGQQPLQLNFGKETKSVAEFSANSF